MGPLQLGTYSSLRPTHQADAKASYDANRAYKDTENNISRAVTVGINRVLHNTYKITSTMVMIGHGRTYPINNNPCTTLDTLHMRYSKTSAPG